MKAFAVTVLVVTPLWIAAAIAAWHAYTTRDSNPDL